MLAGCGGEGVASARSQTQLAEFPADDHAQHVALDLEIVLARQFLRADQIETRLRFMGIGDRRSTDLEIPLRLLQLLRDGLLAGAHRRQILLRVQHVEIRLRDAQDQILRGLRENRLGLRDLPFGLPILDDVLPAEQRLGQADVVRMRVVVLFQRRLAVDGTGSRSTPSPPSRRSPAAGRPSLRQFSRPASTVARAAAYRIVGERLAIHLQQIGGYRLDGEGRPAPAGVTAEQPIASIA